LQRRGPTLPIVFLSGHADVESAVRAMKAGAVDFLTKPVKREVLLEAVQRALALDARQRTIGDEARRLQAHFTSLTQRQRGVFQSIVAGKLNKQIAYDLGLGERTVKREREQVMMKLEARSAADLGRLAEMMQCAARKQQMVP